MKLSLLGCVGLCVSTGILLSSTAEAQCPVSDGAVVVIEDAVSAYNRMSNDTLTKGEFETSEQFAVRKTTVGNGSNAPLLIQAVWDSKHVQYDADNQRFIVVAYAWDNLGVDWSDALENGAQYGIKGSLSSPHGTVLHKEIKEGRSYDATNAYGVTTRVVEITDTKYAVYDRKRRSYDESSWSTEFKVDAVSGGNTKMRGPAVSVPVPIDKAKQISGKLQAGIYFQPKGPKILSGDGTFSATINAPYDKDFQYRIFVGDILCAVITDPDGKVLKTVPPGY